MDAIEIALRGLDVGVGDEVITTPITAKVTATFAPENIWGRADGNLIFKPGKRHALEASHKTS